MNRALLTMTVCCLLGACAPLSTPHSFDALSQSCPTDAALFAVDAAQELSRRYPPAQTTLHLEATDAFGRLFERHLREQGFAVTTAALGGLDVTYTVDRLIGTSLPSAYLRVSLSDGTAFSLVRKVGVHTFVPTPLQAPAKGAALAERPLSAPETLSPPASLPTPPVSPRSSVVPQPIQQASGQILLPKAVLTVLPYNWRYTIPVVEKRSQRVSSPKNIPWRDAVAAMAHEAGCQATFDEQARRVTIQPLPQSTSASIPVATVAAAPAVSAALHPASLPEPSPDPVQEVQTVSAMSSPPVAQTVSISVPEQKEQKAEASPVKKALEESAITPPPATEVEEEPLETNPQVPLEVWTVETGSLHDQLEAWTKRAGYQLVWKAAMDLEMESRATFQGTFVEVIRQLFQGLAHSGHALTVTLHQGNHVMEVNGD